MTAVGGQNHEFPILTDNDSESHPYELTVPESKAQPIAKTTFDRTQLYTLDWEGDMGSNKEV